MYSLFQKDKGNIGTKILQGLWNGFDDSSPTVSVDNVTAF